MKLLSNTLHRPSCPRPARQRDKCRERAHCAAGGGDRALERDIIGSHRRVAAERELRLRMRRGLAGNREECSRITDKVRRRCRTRSDKPSVR